jgi:hypothetical protein
MPGEALPLLCKELPKVVALFCFDNLKEQMVAGKEPVKKTVYRKPRTAGGTGEAPARLAPKARFKAKAKAKANPKETPRVISPEAALVYHSAARNVGRALHVPNAMSSFITIDSVGRHHFTTSTTAPLLYVFQWCPSNCRGMHYSSTAGTVYVDTAMQAIQLGNSTPESIRPLRQSVTLKNVTKADNVSGTVQVLNVPELVKLEFSADDTLNSGVLESLNLMMAAHPKVKTFSAHEMRYSREFVQLPSSQVEFREWQEYTSVGLSLASDKPNRNTVLSNASKRAPMTTLILLFNQTPDQQTYEIVLNCQDACRFDSAKWYATLQTPAKTDVNERAFNSGVQSAHQAASHGLPSSQM